MFVKTKYLVFIYAATIVCIVTIFLLLFGGTNIVASASNSLKGIEKTLKDIYAYLPNDNGEYLVTPHNSDVVSVIVTLDRNYDNFKLILNVQLTNDRNFIIRDYNGKLRNMKIQKFGNYVLEEYYYSSNLEEDERYGHSFLGIGIKDFNNTTGIKIKSIREIIDNYDKIYECIENLPEITIEENNYIIFNKNNSYIINTDSNDTWENIADKILNMDDPFFVSIEENGRYLLYKRQWTEKDNSINNKRIGAEKW